MGLSPSSPAPIQRKAVTAEVSGTPAGSEGSAGDPVLGEGTASPSPAAAGNLPTALKAGVEQLSGVPMDGVNVHYGSAVPETHDAHAVAQGSDIFLGPGAEQHLPHEAWHVAQQRQGRVAGAGTVNSDPALEDEADHRGAEAARVSVDTAPVLARPAPLAAAPSGAAPVQLINVDASDVGKAFNVVTTTDDHCTATLKSIDGGGWYTFETDMGDVRVRGSGNILSRADGMDVSGGETDDEVEGADDLPDDEIEFDPEEIGNEQGVAPKTALHLIADSFRRNPRTIRVHMPFGSKTIAKGNAAYEDPAETQLAPQAMISYRQGDFGKHKKVGKDYDDWAPVLSDDEDSESEKQDLAQQALNFLDGEDSSLGDLPPDKAAAMGGLLLASHVSDRLRTDADSNRVPHDFRSMLHSRASGETGFRDMIGDKNTSSFLPARGGGASQERARLLAQDEVRAQILVRVNNCLIHAIAASAGVAVSFEQLVEIRMRLGSIGQMLLADANTVETILDVLGLDDRGVTIRYLLLDGTPNETLGDDNDDDPLDVFHTGADHFTAVCPNPHQYDMT